MMTDSSHLYVSLLPLCTHSLCLSSSCPCTFSMSVFFLYVLIFYDCPLPVYNHSVLSAFVMHILILSLLSSSCVFSYYTLCLLPVCTHSILSVFSLCVLILYSPSSLCVYLFSTLCLLPVCTHSLLSVSFLYVLILYSLSSSCVYSFIL